MKTNNSKPFDVLNQLIEVANVLDVYGDNRDDERLFRLIRKSDETHPLSDTIQNDIYFKMVVNNRRTTRFDVIIDELKVCGFGDYANELKQRITALLDGLLTWEENWRDKIRQHTEDWKTTAELVDACDIACTTSDFVRRFVELRRNKPKNQEKNFLRVQTHWN
jgi:hypothetical protein